MTENGVGGGGVGGHLKMGGEGGGVKQRLPTMVIDTLTKHMVTDHITRPRDY